MHDGETHVDQSRQEEAALGAERMPPHQPARDDGTRGDRHPHHDPLSGQRAVDVGARGGGVHRVDVPGVERSGVEGAEHAGQHGGDGELPPRGGRHEDRCGADVDDRRGDVDRLAAERVGEPAGGQLEEEHGEPGEGRGRQHLRHRQAAFQRPEGGQPTTRPTGNHRVVVSVRNTRRAAAGDRGPVTTWCRAATRRGRPGRRRCRPRCAWPSGCPARPGGSAAAPPRARCASASSAPG